MIIKYNDILLSYSVQCVTIIYISKTLYDFTVVIFSIIT